MYMHCHALTICQLPSCNLFTQHVSYLLWRDTTSELWTPVHSFTLIKQPQTANCSFFIRCNLILIFHTRRLILCFQQAGEIDNLTVSLGQSTVIVLCAGPRCWSCCAVRSTNNLLKNRCYYWFDNLGFILREDLLLNYIIPSSWGFPTSVWFNTTQASSFSGAVAGEQQFFCKGSFTLPISLLCFCLA